MMLSAYGADVSSDVELLCVTYTSRIGAPRLMLPVANYCV
jgi:hypothetical protein